MYSYLYIKQVLLGKAIKLSLGYPADTGILPGSIQLKTLLPLI